MINTKILSEEWIKLEEKVKQLPHVKGWDIDKISLDENSIDITLSDYQYGSTDYNYVSIPLSEINNSVEFFEEKLKKEREAEKLRKEKEALKSIEQEEERQRQQYLKLKDKFERK